MVDVAVTILQVVVEIRDVTDGIQENDEQARRLSERVKGIHPAVLAVKNGRKRLSSESLRQVLETVENIRNFLDEYARMTKLTRVWKRKSNAAKFKEFRTDLSDGRQALQLDVVVDTWAKEDASDRLEDIAHLKYAIKREQRNSSIENRAEFTRAVKELEKDERSELKALSAWVEIDFDKELDLDGSLRLGSGGFGEVRTATWNGSYVAVKHLRADDVRRDLIHALRKEIRIHASLHFDHVVQLYAASTVAPNLCMVMEYASEGSLWQYLHSSRGPLAPPLQSAFLFDIAKGMSFLHKKGILHRDLKSANVLVFANRRLKLCDFGLSKIKAESSSRSARGSVGTSQWMSPEEMDGNAATIRTDVYSFGVVCFEVATRMEPFRGMMPTQVMRAVADKGRRPEIPRGLSASPDVVSLMERCWKQGPAQRPEGFEPVVQELAGVVKRVGDPRTQRLQTSAANCAISSRGVKHTVGDVTSVSASTAPPSAKGDLDPSPLDSMSVKKPGSASTPAPVPSAPGAATDRAFLQNATAMATPTKEPIAAAAPAPAPPTQDAGTDRSFVQKAIDTVAPLLLAGFDRTQATTAPSPPSPVRDATTDRAALLTLYLVTHGPWKESNFFGLVKKGGWKNRKGWATSRPTSGWWGIGTSSVGRITRLSLSRNNLRGPIPKEIGALTAVEHLDVSYNELSGPLPKEIGALTALKNLSLFHNQLSGPIPKEIGALTALQRLSLSYNELTGPIPKELQGLKSLKYMECHSNGLSERNKAEIKRMLRSVSYNVHL